MKGTFLIFVVAFTLWFAVGATEPKHPTLMLPWVHFPPGVAGCGPRGCVSSTGEVLEAAYWGIDSAGKVRCWVPAWDLTAMPPWRTAVAW